MTGTKLTQGTPEYEAALAHTWRMVALEAERQAAK